MTYITHITLNTGHTSRIQQGDVSGETLARVTPWLHALLQSGQLMPIPVSGLGAYTAHAAVQDGALVLTVNGPTVTDVGPLLGVSPPVVTIGVAKKSRHDHLWGLLTGPVMPLAKTGITRPQSPWCGVVIHPTIAMHLDALEWLGDFERCIAWAWVS